MPIDRAALAQNISALAGLDAEHGLGRAMQQITSAAKALLRVDGAGLMLADERGQLRWATASDQETQIIEEGQERLGEGPCVNAFAEHAPMVMRDAAKEPQWGKITDVVTGQEMRAGLSVPVQLEGGRSAPWTCTRPSRGTGTRARSAPPRSSRRWRRPCSARRSAPRSGGGWPSSADGVRPSDPDRAGQGDADAAGGDRRRRGV
jgi:GAF domain-containing protein